MVGYSPSSHSVVFPRRNLGGLGHAAPYQPPADRPWFPFTREMAAKNKVAIILDVVLSDHAKAVRYLVVECDNQLYTVDVKSPGIIPGLARARGASVWDQRLPGWRLQLMEVNSERPEWSTLRVLQWEVLRPLTFQQHMREVRRKHHLRARTIEEALFWVETKRHHIASLLDNGSTQLRGDGSNVLTVPATLAKKFTRYTEPSRDPFDARMFRANSYGRYLLNVAGMREALRQAQAKHPRIPKHKAKKEPANGHCIDP